MFGTANVDEDEEQPLASNKDPVEVCVIRKTVTECKARLQGGRVLGTEL